MTGMTVGTLFTPLALSFINGGLLGFLGLTAIPIIIYLINRQRYQRVPWAAMEFLLRAMRKNRRRLRFENLLLLIIRTLIILLFVLGMCRPLLETPGGIIPTTLSRSEILVIDRSYSMALKEGSRTLLFQAVEDAKLRIGALSEGDRVGLFLGGGTPETLLSKPQFIAGNEQDAGNRILELLEQVDIVYRPLDVPFTLQSVAQWIQENGAGGSWMVHLYTDLQRRDWMEDDGSDPATVDAVKRLEELGAEIIVHRVGTEKPRNASIVDLRCRDRVLAVDLATAFEVSVHNPSTETLAGLDVELWVGDEVQASRTVSLDPGERETVSFPYVFRETGLVRVKAALLSDALEHDNFRYWVAEVRESVDVAIIDGGYLSPDDSEADYLDAAIGLADSDISGVRLTPYQTRVVPADRLSTIDLSTMEVVILANVGPLQATDSDQLEAFLRKGGGVLTFLGRRIQVADYKRHGYRAGEGWFPFSPHQVIEFEDRGTTYGWEIVNPGHPVLEYLSETPDAGIDLVRVNGFIEPGPVADESILMRLDNDFKTPVLVEKRFGKGVVLVMNTTADRSWNNFPVTPSYVVFLHETLPYLVAGADVPRNLGVGEPFSRVVPSEEFATRVLLISPEGDGVPLVLEELPGGDSFALEVQGQREPGNYQIRFEKGGIGDERREASDYFAVNADSEEGVLNRILPEELSELYPSESLQVTEQGRSEGSAQSTPPQRSGELWRTIFWAVLALLATESLLARYFGRQRGRTT